MPHALERGNVPFYGLCLNFFSSIIGMVRIEQLLPKFGLNLPPLAMAPRCWHSIIEITFKSMDASGAKEIIIDSCGIFSCFQQSISLLTVFSCKVGGWRVK